MTESQRFRNDSYSDSRTDILRMIPQKPYRVLDVGCSTGNLGRSIKIKYNSYVLGLDSDLDSLSEAKSKIDDVFQVDLDKFENSLSDFDLIICADVLEHTKYPANVLSEISKCLTPEGSIIISLPNVQHWTVFLNLLLGKWPERDRGIFDYTHLRFFTLNSIISLSSKCGFRIIKISRNFRLIDRPFHSLNKLSIIFKFLPLKNFFTYQYVVLLSRSQTC